MVEATTTTQTLLGAYKFSDFQVEDWLNELWSCKSNAEFKTAIEANKLAQKLNDHFKASYEANFVQKAAINDENN